MKTSYMRLNKYEQIYSSDEDLLQSSIILIVDSFEDNLLSKQLDLLLSHCFQVAGWSASNVTEESQR